MEKNDSYSRGTVVLATVFGDVHESARTSSRRSFPTNGYTVHDLGKQVPVDRIVNAAVEKKADAIGLSACSSPLAADAAGGAGDGPARSQAPVLIGGAAINRKYGWRTAYVEGTDKLYDGASYCRDAFEGWTR